MKNHMPKLMKAIFTSVIVLLSMINTRAQCQWLNKLYDSYEYTSAIPHLIPGTTVHTTPQSFAAHTGSKSVYMNFSNALPAGSLVYSRPIGICPNVPLQVSAWLTTTFSGVQCDAELLVLDGNNDTLAYLASLPAPYYPTWVQYQSGIITPTTSSITFNLYTNVAGSQGGNDLSMDDFLVQYCSTVNIGNDTTICNYDSLTLNAGMGYSSYLWNNGFTTQSITVGTSAPGTTMSTYYVFTTDSSGCFFGDTIEVTFTPCTGIIETSETSSVMLYPNPSSDFMMIQSNLEFQYAELWNTAGQIIWRGDNTRKISTHTLPGGMYMLHLITYEGDILHRKVFVQH